MRGLLLAYGLRRTPLLSPAQRVVRRARICQVHDSEVKNASVRQALARQALAITRPFPPVSLQPSGRSPAGTLSALCHSATDLRQAACCLWRTGHKASALLPSCRHERSRSAFSIPFERLHSNVPRTAWFRDHLTERPAVRSPFALKPSAQARWLVHCTAPGHFTAQISQSSVFWSAIKVHRGAICTANVFGCRQPPEAALAVSGCARGQLR